MEGSFEVKVVGGLGFETVPEIYENGTNGAFQDSLSNTLRGFGAFQDSLSNTLRRFGAFQVSLSNTLRGFGV